MSKDFYKAVEDRRTIYNISGETTVSDEKIQEIVKHAVKHTPSAFNSQNGRVIILFGQHHNQLWDITKNVLKEIVPSEKFKGTEEKINSFKAGYGSILYYEDMAIVESLKKQFPTYKDNFPVWSHHSIGMLQYVIWTALEIEGLGASLQHYNPIIDDAVRKQWNVPSNWKLVAQMPFGQPTSGPSEKEYQPLDQRVKIFK